MCSFFLYEIFLHFRCFSYLLYSYMEDVENMEDVYNCMELEKKVVSYMWLENDVCVRFFYMKFFYIFGVFPIFYIVIWRM